MWSLRELPLRLEPDCLLQELQFVDFGSEATYTEPDYDLLVTHGWSTQDLESRVQHQLQFDTDVCTATLA